MQIIGLIGFRIFLGLEEPISTASKEIPIMMICFCRRANVWQMSAEFNTIKAWFIFLR
jgi:hypothetical protein